MQPVVSARDLCQISISSCTYVQRGAGGSNLNSTFLGSRSHRPDYVWQQPAGRNSGQQICLLLVLGCCLLHQLRIPEARMTVSEQNCSRVDRIHAVLCSRFQHSGKLPITSMHASGRPRQTTLSSGKDQHLHDHVVEELGLTSWPAALSTAENNVLGIFCTQKA